MRKNLFLLPLLSLITTVAWGADQYQFNGDPGCALKKFADKKWAPAQADEIGAQLLTIQPAKFGLSTFKANGTWYSAKTDCMVKVAAADISPSSTSSSDTAGVRMASGKGKMYAEFRLTDFMMTGSGAGGTTTTATGSSAVTQKYSPSLGFSGRGGYMLDDRASLFLDIGYFSGSQTGTETLGTSTGALTLNDKIINVNVGYHRLFGDKGLIPFAAGSLGYSHLSSTFAYAFTTPINLTTTASTYNITLEGGVLYALSKSFSVMGSLDYVIMSVGTETVSTSNSGANPAGTALANTLGYSRLGINLGARYSF